jgi:hypothetical protein
MINFEQIKEIKKRITHARMTLMQCYNSFTFIEEIDLAEIKELSAEHSHFLRTKAAHARIKMGLRLNELFSLWESHFMDYRAEKKEDEVSESKSLTQG